MKIFLSRLTPFQATFLFVLVFTIVRLVAAGSIDLTIDEAHYALYGLHLEWSYFDHPPLVGWLQALVLQISDSDLALRTIPILLFSAASLVLFRVCTTLFPDETPWLGFISVAIIHSSIVLQLLGLALVPDSPLLLLGLLVILALHGVVSKGSLRYWLWLGLWLGLAGLSKYTAASLIGTVLLALLLSGQWRQLFTPGPWLALIMGLVIIMPVVYWNYSHDWISFLYQIKIHHGANNPSWEFKRFLLSQASQFIVYGPASYVFGMIAVFAGLRNFKKLGEQNERGVMLCLALALPLFFMFGWNSGYFITMPHWISLAWLAVSPLAALWILCAWNYRRWVSAVVYSSIVYAVLLTGVVFSQLVSPWIPFPNNDQYYLRDLYGWKQAAQRAEQLRVELAKSEGPVPLIFTEEWTQASRLAWYARPTPVQVLDNENNQSKRFEYWFGSPQNGTRGILVIWPGKLAKPEKIGSGQFGECSLLERMPININGHLASTFSFYACQHYHN
jgi:4-amino-4-deoxy-L-arabinose transferase-like glycosyltransferase